MSDSEPTLRPRPDPTWRAIACGGFHCVALRDDGRVVTWGSQRNYRRRDVPAETGHVAISCGFYHSVALREDGRVVIWGSQTMGEMFGGAPTDAGYVAITCWIGGTGGSAVLREDGRVCRLGTSVQHERRGCSLRNVGDEYLL